MTAILDIMSGTVFFFIYDMSIYVVEMKIDHFPMHRMVAITNKQPMVVILYLV